ncbi:phage structural protein [Paenibacillus xylanexedens]|uniref:phage structural protein n=1 Tax=Paenibacillus xylanexedens TaxID=528191 RepID=UPI000F53E5B5|nr:phage protein [Paenibacillus xylanexedens]RPK29868.1 hypothetical protein EDO6_00492 [Paenibacillus xylanexedens]
MKTYDPKDITVTIKGVYLTGFSEDMVEIEKDEENFETKVGAQGDAQRNKINNPLATVTITLLGSSPQIKFMNNLANTGELFPFSLIDAGLDENVTATEAYVKKQPTRTYGTELEDREFELQLIDAQFE